VIAILEVTQKIVKNKIFMAHFLPPEFNMTWVFLGQN
jgi:hypothetical protein